LLAALFPAYLALSIAAVDDRLARWFHARLNGLTGPAWQALSFAAGGKLMLVALVSAVLLLAYKRRWERLLTLVLTVPCGILIGEILKLIVRRPRPYLQGPFVDWVGYSFPSGHAISAPLFYGFLSIWLCSVIRARRWRAFGVCLSVLMTLLVSCSRVALGAHYLTDVLAGMLFGVLWLTACMTGRRALHRRFRTRFAPSTAEQAAANAANAAAISS